MDLRPSAGSLPPSGAESTILRWLAAQDFAPGTRLPSERDLGQALGLSRHQVRQTLISLERRGPIVRTKDGWWTCDQGDAELTGAVVVFAAHPAATLPDARPSWNYLSRIWEGMTVAAARHGIRLMTILSGDVDPGLVRRLAKQRPLGVVCLGDAVRQGQALALAKALWSAEIPVVAMGDWIRPHELDQWPADLVLGGHAHGMHQQLAWLHARGARRPWLIGCREIQPVPPALWWQTRQDAFRASCHDLSLTVPPPCAPLVDPAFDYTLEGFAEQARITAGYLIAPLAAGADAFLCANDPEAFRLRLALTLLGHPPAHDHLLAGFDNNHALIDIHVSTWCGGGPQITYDKDDAAMGRKLIELLILRHQHLLPAAPQRVTIEGRLIDLQRKCYVALSLPPTISYGCTETDHCE